MRSTASSTSSWPTASDQPRSGGHRDARQAFKFAGVTVVTLAEGEISELHVGLQGAMNVLFLKDFADKTPRRLRVGVEKGRVDGGHCYGYRIVKKFDGNGELIRGDREIIPKKAEIVCRVFREFAPGKSPKAIAVDLNRDCSPGPLGDCEWANLARC